MKSSSIEYSYAVNTHNRYSALVEQPAVKRPQQKPKPQGEKTEKSVKPKQTSSKLSDKENSIQKNAVNKVTNTHKSDSKVKTETKRRPQRKTGTEGKSRENVNSEIKIVTDAVEDMSFHDTQKDSRQKTRKDFRKDLAPIGQRHRETKERIYDRGEKVNFMMGRGKKSEKRHGRGPYNWGGVADEVKSQGNPNDNTEGQKRFRRNRPRVSDNVAEVVITTRHESSDGATAPLRKRPERNRAMRQAGNETRDEEKVQEDLTMTLDEFKAKRDKMRLKPKWLKNEAAESSENESHKENSQKTADQPSKQGRAENKVNSALQDSAEDRGVSRDFHADRRGRFGGRGGSGMRNRFTQREERGDSHPREESQTFGERGLRDGFRRGRFVRETRRGGNFSGKERLSARTDESSGEVSEGGYTRKFGDGARGERRSRGRSGYQTGRSAGSPIQRNYNIPAPRGDVELDMSEFPSL